jgi:Domain of unknown function (DUF4440)
MNSFAELVQRISGRHKQVSPSGFERQLIERLHQRLIDALAQSNDDTLAVLLAPDTQWRRGKRIVSGRDAVIDALFIAGENVQALVGATEVRVHGELAVVDALWQSDTTGNLRMWTRSCIFALRRGYWQVINLRDLAIDQRTTLAFADERCAVGSSEQLRCDS